MRACCQAATSRTRVTASGIRRFKHRWEDTQFDLGHVQPTAVLWGVMDFQSFEETPSNGGFESLIESAAGLWVLRLSRTRTTLSAWG